MKKFFMISAAALILLSGCSRKETEDTVKIGLLHSHTGSLAISELPVRDATLLAVKEINEAGGVLGKQIVTVEEDGESIPHTFSEHAKKLIVEDEVKAIFGCWSSACRKAVKTVVEDYYSLLWYPIQYEGMEASPNIMYLGSAPNQQIVPAVDYCLEHFGKKVFIIGSDYIFPRTASRIINAQLKEFKGTCVAEEYVPLDSSRFDYVISRINETKPDVIINLLNGNSNIFFFKALKSMSGKFIPVMSFSIAEEEIAVIGPEDLKGHYLAWSYFHNTDNEKNRTFIENYRKEYGESRVSSAPVETAYFSVYLWAAACEKAKSFDTEKVRIAAKGLSIDTPEGMITVDGSNQHLYKKVIIGRISDDGEIEEIWKTPSNVRPDPYLSAYEWARQM